MRTINDLNDEIVSNLNPKGYLKKFVERIGRGESQAILINLDERHLAFMEPIENEPEASCPDITINHCLIYLQSVTWGGYPRSIRELQIVVMSAM